MDEAGKKRAGAYLGAEAAGRGWSAQRLADEAGIDVGTVRDTMSGKRWSRAEKRRLMEEAIGLEPGTLEKVARGLLIVDEDADPVEAAIQSSELTRGNKAKLTGIYFDMLDEQQGKGAV